MNLSEINVGKLGAMLLPTSFRSASIVEFIRVCLFPINYVQTQFFANRTTNLYNLNHNGQVCKLRAVLNDAFPTRSKTFLIEDFDASGQWQYARDEERLYEQLNIPNEPSYIMLYNESRMSTNAGFNVRIPADLESVDNLNKIKSLVNSYKLVSKVAHYEYY